MSDNSDIEIIQRGRSEDVNDYKIRLCSNKSLYNLSWVDIALLSNCATGAQNSPDSYRKWWARENKKLINSNNLDNSMSQSHLNFENEIDNSIVEDRVVQLQKLKYQMQDQKREYLKGVRNFARFEHIEEELMKAINDLKNCRPIEWIVPESIHSAKRDGVMVFADWHYGLTVDNGFNKFNKNEFNNRLSTLMNDSIKYGKENNINNLHLVVNGDLINGGIHVSTRVNSAESSISQLMNVCEILSECVARYASEFNHVYVYNTLDNHSRLFTDKTEAVNDENLARIIPWYIKSRLHDAKNITIVENKYSEIANFNVLGKTVFAVHGHRDKPEVVVNNLSGIARKVPDYILMGHYHHSQEIEVNGSYVVMTSSLCGSDEYSVNIRKVSNPAQKMLIFEEGRGRICTYNIILGENNNE